MWRSRGEGNEAFRSGVTVPYTILAEKAEVRSLHLAPHITKRGERQKSSSGISDSLDVLLMCNCWLFSVPQVKIENSGNLRKIVQYVYALP